MPIHTYQPSSMTDTKTNDCSRACPTCGGLECLCRPRFFAGQLLTDDALNRLEHYIVEKNKLHNRYLHGWGVVCGLEVVCSPCNAVTVRGGYALSPCGEDIVVCKDVPVDVCSLIEKCKDTKRDWECEPFSMGHELDCKDVEGEWILTVRYDETSSRGITALKGSTAPACCSSCTCGGSSSCGCGCNGHNGNGKGGAQKAQYATTSAGSSKHAYRAAQPTVAAQCEPTLTCEGYVFEVCRPLPEESADAVGRGLKTDATSKSLALKGAMVARVTACISRFFETLPKKPTGPNVSTAALHQWCGDVKRKLRDDLFDHPVYNCQLAQALNFVCPDPANKTRADYEKEIDDVTKNVFAVVAAEYLSYCICSSFLPPCPEAVCDPRVPLASVIIRKDENGSCRVVRVCNLGKRRHVITFPNLGYWFSFIVTPLLRKFRKLLELICCHPFVLPSRQQPQPQQPGVIFNEAPAVPAADATQPVRDFRAAEVITEKRGFKAFAGQVWTNRTRTVDEQTMFLGAVGARDEKNTPYLAETELKNPFFTLTVNRLAGPMLARLPENTLDVLKFGGSLFGERAKLRRAEAAATSPEAGAGVDDVKDLKKRVADLQSTLKKQAKMIDDLQKRMKEQ